MSSPKINKCKGSIATNVALVLFIASLGILAAFAAMMYLNKEEKPATAAINPPLIKPSDTGSDTASALNDLTSQLMTERQLTEDLHSQNAALKNQLQTATLNLNPSDSAYLSALNTVNSKQRSKTPSNTKLETTDYYNKVALDINSNDLLQKQINQFIDSKDKEKTIYIETLKEESNVRNNEVRSIVLKQGETIWMLAKRAYGSGFKYHKIMAANPQITEKNAKYLKIGTRIRVPR